MRVLTLGPSTQTMRRLLSYLPHQEPTPSSHNPSYQCGKTFPGIPVSPPKGAQNGRKRPRTWVLGDTLRVLTLDPSKHITRRLLSYLDHQETTPSRHSPSYQCARHSPNPPKRGTKPSKSAPYMGVRSPYAGLDIRSIVTCHGTSPNIFLSSGDDVLASRSVHPEREYIPT